MCCKSGRITLETWSQRNPRTPPCGNEGFSNTHLSLSLKTAPLTPNRLQEEESDFSWRRLLQKNSLAISNHRFFLSLARARSFSLSLSNTHVPPHRLQEEDESDFAPDGDSPAPKKKAAPAPKAAAAPKVFPPSRVWGLLLRVEDKGKGTGFRPPLLPRCTPEPTHPRPKEGHPLQPRL